MSNASRLYMRRIDAGSTTGHVALGAALRLSVPASRIRSSSAFPDVDGGSLESCLCRQPAER